MFLISSRMFLRCLLENFLFFRCNLCLTQDYRSDPHVSRSLLKRSSVSSIVKLMHWFLNGSGTQYFVLLCSAQCLLTIQWNMCCFRWVKPGYQGPTQSLWVWGGRNCCSGFNFKDYTAFYIFFKTFPFHRLQWYLPGCTCHSMPYSTCPGCLEYLLLRRSH